jgi:hypothetical protein
MTFEYYRTTAKKTIRIELISTVRSLHIGHFLLHTSPFQLVVQVVLCTVKKPHLVYIMSERKNSVKIYYLLQFASKKEYG